MSTVLPMCCELALGLGLLLPLTLLLVGHDILLRCFPLAPQHRGLGGAPDGGGQGLPLILAGVLRVELARLVQAVAIDSQADGAGVAL